MWRACDASEGTSVTFADRTSVEVQAVVWATGYRPDYAWLDLPILDDRGHPIHERGVTQAEGLYFLGMHRQYARGSSLIAWVSTTLATSCSASKRTAELSQQKRGCRRRDPNSRQFAFACRRRDSNPRHADYDSALPFRVSPPNRGFRALKWPRGPCGGPGMSRRLHLAPGREDLPE